LRSPRERLDLSRYCNLLGDTLRVRADAWIGILKPEGNPQRLLLLFGGNQTSPLASPGIIAGCLLGSLSAVDEFLTPDLPGGSLPPTPDAGN
jgi:ABC-type spermidine/putrescine transport system permease subunit I